MRKLLSGLLISTLLLSCANSKLLHDANALESDNQLSSKEKADGWVLLFDGQTKNGWQKFDGSPTGAAWTIENGTLFLNTAKKEQWQTQDGGDIVTDESYGNFHLKLDWKIAPNGNSGIMFHVNQQEKQYQWPWQTGPEMQILDNNGHPDAKIIKHRAGDLYDLISAQPETAKPAMQWNHAEIIVQNSKLQLWLNHVKVVETTLWNDQWRTMISNSKFKDMKGFGSYNTGKIALQDHGDTVWFKNIKIKKL